MAPGLFFGAVIRSNGLRRRTTLSHASPNAGRLAAVPGTNLGAQRWRGCCDDISLDGDARTQRQPASTDDDDADNVAPWQTVHPGLPLRSYGFNAERAGAV